MRCKKCKTPLRKGPKFCPKCGANVKHTARNFLLIALAAALLFGGAGVASWKLGLFQTTGGDNDENFVLLSGSFTDRLIVDQASALAAIGDVADILGIEDVNAEFSECKVDTVSGNTYYRFYQEYEGIPVYGRSIIVAADGYGNSLTLSGNYLNVRNIETTPQIDENLALEYTKLHYGENINVSNGGLKIYSLNNMSPELVWTMYINSDTINESCFISAKGGNVIAQISLSYTDDISHKGVDVDGETLNFNTTTLGALYSLEDEERNIHVYNAGNETLLFELLNSGGLYGLKLYTHPIGSDEKVLTPVAISQFGDWEDAYAITSMGRTAMVYDFYDLVLNHIGFANSNAPIYVAYNDYFDGVVEQAMSSWFKLEDGSSAPVTLLHFGSETSLSIDLIAHEYTHSVEHAISSMVYLGESGALMESYSDILGECIEDWSYLIDNNGEKRYDTNHLMDDSCDWLHNGGTRDLVNPENSTEGDFTPHPRIYQGSNWVDTSDSFDYGGVHINSTVISHAAYLMNTGIGGNPNYQALSTEDLAHLFYETLYTLPSDCTFSQFRTLVENTADIMCQQGALTEKQRLCVSNAFFQVGIAPTTTPVAKELTLDIYGVDGLPYEDYTLYVRHYSGAEKTYTSETIMKEGISFPTIGSYELCIVDNANTDNQTSITVKVVDHGGAVELPVFTQCGLSKIDGPITAPSSGNSTPLKAYMEAANRTTATGSWTEDMNMTASMVLKNGNSTTKSKATMEASVDIEGWNGTDTSSLYMSGSASMSVLNQTIAYTMTWQNGTAHYEYTEPTVTSADLKVDPSYFNFNSLTDDMIISSAMNGNQITLSIRGDALTKTGISAVNSLLSGVENLSYEDATVNVTVNEQSGKIDTLTMTFHASMTYQGYDAETDYEIHYAFSENTAQIKDGVPVADNNRSAQDMWLNFLSSGEYEKFTTGWAELYDVNAYGNEPYPTDYAILDIDGDGWEELILYRSQNDGLGFGWHSVLCCDKSTGNIRIVPTESRLDEGNASFDEIAQSCKGVSYSPDYHALVYTELNNGMMFSDYGYWILKDGRLIFDFSIGHEGYSGSNIYYISQGGNSQEISEMEHANYVANWERIDFLPISDVKAASGLSTTDAINESYLEDLPYSVWDRYTGNMGDSFIDKVGTRNSSTDINGVEYSHGLECWIARWNYKDETSWAWKEWALNKSYSTIQGEITVSADCYNRNNYVTNIEFVGDGEILCSYTLTPETNYPIVFSIDISRVETLRISVEDNGSFSGGTSFILGNITLT